MIFSTKGNIDQLSTTPVAGDRRLHLWELAGFIVPMFGSNVPIIAMLALRVLQLSSLLQR
jgi:hypothetical protein